MGRGKKPEPQLEPLPTISAEAVESPIEVVEEEVAEAPKTKTLAEQIAEVERDGEAEYKRPDAVPDEAEDLEIPDDEAAYEAARQRLHEPIIWDNPDGSRVGLREFSYTDQQWWAVMRHMNQGGLLDDSLMIVFLGVHSKKDLRKLWRENQWGETAANGDRKLLQCPLLDAFEDWKDATFRNLGEAEGSPASPGSPVNIYIESWLRIEANKTREVEGDEETEKKPLAKPSGQISSANM